MIKDKAKELVDKMYNELTKGYADNDIAQILAYNLWHNEAKQCALICVENEKKAVADEIEKISPFIPNDTLREMSTFRQMEYIELRNEIEKL